MKIRTILAVLFLCVALLCGGCGSTAPDNGKATGAAAADTTETPDETPVETSAETSVDIPDETLDEDTTQTETDAEEPSTEDQAPEVRVRVVAEEELLRSTWSDLVGCDEFTAYTGDYPVLLLYTAVTPVKDFRVLALSMVDVREDGSPVFDTEELYALDELAPERSLLVRTSFPGDLPTNGFSYVGADGTTHCVAVWESGYDGSLVTEEFQP